MRKTLTIILSAAISSCFFLFSSMAPAGNITGVNDHEDTVQSIGMCPKCKTAYMSICAGNYMLVDEGEHTYLFVKKCYAYYYEANHDFLCSCGDSYYGEIGRHECYEKHTSCSLSNKNGGIYNICFCDIKSQ